MGADGVDAFFQFGFHDFGEGVVDGLVEVEVLEVLLVVADFEAFFDGGFF